MPRCTLVISDQVNCKFTDLDPFIRRKFADALKFMVPHARHMPAYKLGRWDGKVSFGTVGGATYINLLDRVLPLIMEAGYEIDIDDKRPDFHPKWPEVTDELVADRCWPEGHPMAGEPIFLRDYQVEAIKTYLANPQSIQSISTGAGKCVDYDTLIEIEIDENTPFGRSLLSMPEIRTNPTGLTLKMGQLVEAVAAFRNRQLEIGEEIVASDLGIKVPTHLDGISATINGVIKKRAPSVTIAFENGHKLTCADKHILLCGGAERFAETLWPGEAVDTVNGPLVVKSVLHGAVQDFYDIGIDYPHLYRDAAGLIHHNTLLTAALSLTVERATGGRTIVIVPSKNLVEQTEEDYRNLGLDVGVFYGDRKEWGHTHTIATWQSLSVFSKKSEGAKFKKGSKKAAVEDEDIGITIEDFLDGVVCVMCDETHTVKGDELRKLLCGPMAHIPIRWGLTGTIPKEDYEFMSLLASLGPVVGEIRAADLQERNVLAKCKIEILQLEEDHVEFRDYAEEYDYLVRDKTRIQWIADFTAKLAAETGNTLILVDRIDTGEMLEQMIPGSVFISGRMKTKDRKTEFKEVAVVNNKVIIATFGVAAVGINAPRIFNLLFLECGKSFVRTIQSIGRVLRKANDKDSAMVYDLTSTLKFSKRHLSKRKAYYDEAGYPYVVRKIRYRG